MSDGASVLCVLVNYRTDDLALGFARDLWALNGNSRLQLMMVDNTDLPNRDRFRESVAAAFPGALYCRPAGNLGYFGGAAYGLERFLASRRMPDWVMVSNVDLKVADKTFFEHLGEFSKNRDVGIVGPSIWSAKSVRDLNPRYVHRPGARKIRRLKYINRFRLILNVYEALGFGKAAIKYACSRGSAILRGGRERLQAPKPIRIYAPQGSCMLFSKLYFKRGGSLFYPCFLFGEELFVAETARKLGLSVYYHPQMKLVHHDHASTGFPRSREMSRWISQSSTYLADTLFRE